MHALTPTLQTPRLVLRALCAEDAPRIQQLFPHWDIVKDLSTKVPWPYPDDGAEAWIAMVLPKMVAGKDSIWAITERPSDALIGVVHYMTEDTGSGHRGFWLGLPWHGRGYMTEAVRAVQDHLFFDCGIERLVLLNATDNLASAAIKKRSGATLLDEVPFPHLGGCTHAQRWELTRAAWAKARSR